MQFQIGEEVDTVIRIDISDEASAKGHKIGESRPGIFGGMHHYDAKGHKVGESRPGVFGGANHYDANGHKTGHSSKGIFGDWNHYDD